LRLEVLPANGDRAGDDEELEATRIVDGNSCSSGEGFQAHLLVAVIEKDDGRLGAGAWGSHSPIARSDDDLLAISFPILPEPNEDDAASLAAGTCEVPGGFRKYVPAG